MLEKSTSSEVSVEANHARDLQGAILLGIHDDHCPPPGCPTQPAIQISP